jgi:hypothetical protein
MWKLLVTLTAAAFTVGMCSYVTTWQAAQRPVCGDVLIPTMRAVTHVFNCGVVTSPQVILLNRGVPVSLRSTFVCRDGTYWLQVMAEWDTELVRRARAARHVVLSKCRIPTDDDEDVLYEINLVTLVVKTTYAGN